MFKPIYFLVSVRSNRHFSAWAIILMILFIFASSVLQPIPVAAQSSPDAAEANLYLPFMQRTLSTTSTTPLTQLSIVYDLERLDYVTDVVNLAPFEAKRWGRGEIVNAAYSPIGDQLAVATDAGVWLYRLDEPDNGRLFTDALDARSVIWSPDGRQVGSVSSDDIVRIWDVASGEEVSVLEGHMDRVTGISWSPDGTQIVSGSRDDTVRIWDVATGEELDRLKHTDAVLSVSWSLDGDQIVFAATAEYYERGGSYADSLFIWDLANNKKVSSFGTAQSYSVSWSPNGSQILSHSYGFYGFYGLCIWDAVSIKFMHCFDGHTDLVTSASWSPDGSQVISSSDDGTVRIWDVASGEEVSRMDHIDGAYIVNWSPDGSQVVSVSQDNTVRIWDMASGAEMRSLNHMAGVRSMSWSPDGRHAASVSGDDIVRIWDVASGEEIRSLDRIAPLLEQDTVDIWDVASDAETVSLNRMKGVNSISWSLDGSQLFFNTENEFCIWDMTSGEVLSCQRHALGLGGDSWSPDGSHVADTIYNNYTVQIWNVETGNQVGELTGHTDDVNSVSWSPDGSQIVSGSEDKTMRLWDVASGEEVRLLTGHGGAVDSVSWSADGSLVASGSDDNTVRVWNVESGAEIRRFQGHTEGVLSVSWSPDSRYLVSGASDRTVRIWDVTSGIEVSTFAGHALDVNSVSWSPDGSQVLSISDDDTMRLWNVPFNEPDDDSTGTSTIPKPSIELLKVGTVNDLDGDGITDAGETITYSFTVRNTGNVDLFSIIVTDTLVTFDDGPIQRLASGDVDTTTFSAVYTLTESDILSGSVSSSAVANAIYGLDGQINDISDDPNNLDNNDTDGNGDPDDPTIVMIEMMPRLALKKIGNFRDENGDGVAQAGETISYALIVENMGNVDLTNVVITDTLLTVTGDPIALPTGAEKRSTFKVLYTITMDDIAAPDDIAMVGVVSEATAIGIDPSGGTVKYVLDSLTHSPLLPAVYHPDHADYVTDLVELVPLEAERWGRGRIANSVYSPTGEQLAVATSMGVWIYQLDAPDNGRLFAHVEPVSSVSWSPDGIQVASGSDDGAVRIWDVASGEMASSLFGQAEKISSVSWSPDGSRVASGSHYGTVRVWDVMSGEVMNVLNHRSDVNSVNWSPDSRHLVSGSGNLDRYDDDDDQRIIIWDVASGEQVSYLGGYMSPISSVSWSPDGSQVASGSRDKTVRIWDVASGTEVSRLDMHTDLINSVSWSPDGTQVASGSGNFDREYSTVRIWDVASGEEVIRLNGRTSEINGVNWSPDGSQLASGADNIVEIWDVATGEKVSSLFGHTDQVNSVSWSPNGSQVTSGSGESFSNEDTTVRIWDVASGSVVHHLEGHTQRVNSVSWSPDGSQVASGSGEFSGGGSSLRIWDAVNGKQESFLMDYSNYGVINSVSWSPDGSQVASGSADSWPGPGYVLIWDVASGEIVHSFGERMSVVNSVSWSPDGSQVVAGVGDGTVRIWDVASGEEVYFDWHGQYDKTLNALSIRWSLDGSQVVAGTTGGTVRIWDVASREELSSLRGHTDSSQSLSWSPDGNQLASGSKDGTVRIWNMANNEEVRRLEGHASGVESVSWSPDGSQVVSGSADGTIRIWNVE